MCKKLIIAIGFLASACIDDTSQEKIQQVGHDYHLQLDREQGKLVVLSKGVKLPINIKTLVVKQRDLSANIPRQLRAKLNNSWVSQPLVYERVEFSFTEKGTDYDCAVKEGFDIAEAGFDRENCTNEDQRRASAIKFLDSFFKECQAELRKGLDGEILTSERGYWLHEEVSATELKEENKKDISEFKGYVYKKEKYCSSSDPFSDPLVFVVMPEALPYLERNLKKCDLRSSHASGAWRFEFADDADGSHGECKDKLVILDSDASGKKLNLIIKVSDEWGKYHTNPNHKSRVVKGQWFVFPEGGAVLGRGLVEKEIEFIPIPVSF